MKENPAKKRLNQTTTASNSGDSWQSIGEELMDEHSNQNIDHEFLLDELFPDRHVTKIKLKAENSSALNQIGKQVNELHKLSFTDIKDLSNEEMKNKMKAQILSSTNKRLK